MKHFEKKLYLESIQKIQKNYQRFHRTLTWQSTRLFVGAAEQSKELDAVTHFDFCPKYMVWRETNKGDPVKFRGKIFRIAPRTPYQRAIDTIKFLRKKAGLIIVKPGANPLVTQYDIEKPKEPI